MPIGPHSNQILMKQWGSGGCDDGGSISGRGEFNGVETPFKPKHISKKQLCRMEAGSVKGAQFHS